MSRSVKGQGPAEPVEAGSGYFLGRLHFKKPTLLPALFIHPASWYVERSTGLRKKKKAGWPAFRARYG
ncbi:Fe-hydrogenase assembly protein [Meiothermus ruber H328]|nr:Fe-hydrogenase assembly protein [Meiothermus ruber H328]